MEIQTLLLLIAALACPIGMGVMMWMMNRHASGGDMPGQHLSETERLKTLRERRRLLEQEIAETEKIVTLQAQKEVMADSQSADLLKG